MRPPGPAVAPQVGLGVGRQPRRRQDQEEREIGGGLVEHAGRVAHRDAELGRGGDVDVVVADGHVRDDLHAAAGRGRVEHAGVDAIGEQADHRVDVGDRGPQLVGRERRVVGALHDLVPRGDERIEPAVGQLAGDEDASHRVEPTGRQCSV